LSMADCNGMKAIKSSGIMFEENGKPNESSQNKATSNRHKMKVQNKA